MYFRVLTSTLFFSVVQPLEIANLTQIYDQAIFESQNLWGQISSVTIRKSRKKMLEFQPKDRIGEENIPTLIFHGIR